MKMPSYTGSGGTERWTPHVVLPTAPTSPYHHRNAPKHGLIPSGLLGGAINLLTPLPLRSISAKPLPSSSISAKPLPSSSISAKPWPSSSIELRKWEDEKIEKMNELQHPETSCREPSSEHESIESDPAVASDLGRPGPSSSSRKRWRSPERPPKTKTRRRRRGRYAERGGQSELIKVDVLTLRYSQLTCCEAFQCGRRISQLVQDLMDRKVRLSAPFLRLTVYEDVDEETDEPILKCIDNRRLFALKEFAKRSNQVVKVSCKMYDRNTLDDVGRIWRNSDRTNGRDVKLRKGRRNKRRHDQY